MGFSVSQKRALAIIPKCTGFFSLIGSSLILMDVLRSKRKRGNVYHRLLLGLSTSDILASLVNVLSTWPTPRGTPGVFQAVGTTGTCTAQGFFNEAGNMTTPLYNASLCIYFSLVIRFSWSERKVRRAERYLHAVPLFIGWTMAIVGLPFKLYNNSGWLCWIAPHPSNCLLSSDTQCERGELANLFRWIHYGIIWGAIAFVSLSLFLMYRTVSQKEKATARYRSSSFTLHADRRILHSGRRSITSGRSRNVADQAMLFVAALLLTWTFTTLTRIFQITQGKSYYPLLVLMAIFFPLQGFFNSFIYFRPRYLRCRAQNEDLFGFQVVYIILTSLDPEIDVKQAKRFSLQSRGSFHSRSSFQSRSSQDSSAAPTPGKQRFKPIRFFWSSGSDPSEELNEDSADTNSRAAVAAAANAHHRDSLSLSDHPHHPHRKPRQRRSVQFADEILGPAHMAELRALAGSDSDDDSSDDGGKDDKADHEMDVEKACEIVLMEHGNDDSANELETDHINGDAPFELESIEERPDVFSDEGEDTVSTDKAKDNGVHVKE